MKILSNIKAFLTSDHTPRWQVAAAFLVALLAPIGTSNYYYVKSKADEKVREEHKRIEGKLLELERNSIEFQTYAGAFINSVLENSDNLSQRRSDLVANILAQDASIDVAYASFDEHTAIAAQKYRSALLNMRASVENTEGIDTMGPFWKNATELLVARNELLEALDAQATLPGS